VIAIELGEKLGENRWKCELGENRSPPVRRIKSLILKSVTNWGMGEG
jgi:hypothetical protein